MSVRNHIPTVRYLEPIDYTKSGRERWQLQDEYENNTYIDWMKESAGRRVDSSVSRKWGVLVLMALAVGYTTVFIDLASVWLNDLKKGLCLSKPDKWSLLNPYLTCPAEDWYDWLRLISGSTGTVGQIFINFPIYLTFVSVFVLIAGFITLRLAPLVKQSGIPELKLIIAGFNYYMASYLGPLALVYKICGLILVVSSGFWLGKEGPLVHVAACILTMCFKYIYGDTMTEGVRRELLSAAVATGIAVAFNSPIGGVLFVVELLPSYFISTKTMWNSFVSATIALIALSGFKVFTEGKNFHEQDLFQVSFGNFSWLFLESIPFILLGLMGGMYGYAYTRTYLWFASTKTMLWSKISRTFGINQVRAQYVELACVAFITAICTFALSMTRLPLGAYLKLLFTDCPTEVPDMETNSLNFMCGSSSVGTILKLGYIFIQGFFLSSYSYSLSLPGGILMPSLVLGGTIGRLVGLLSQLIQNTFDAELLATCTTKSCIVSPSSYAVVGAASFVSGITKLTLSVVVIMFELTGAVTYVLPIMIAVMTSKFFNDSLCEENIYDAWLSNEFNVAKNTSSAELNLNKGDGLCSFENISVKFKVLLPDISVDKVMVPLGRTRHLYLFPEEPYSLSALYGFLSDDNHEGYPLLASELDNTNLGYLPKKVIYKLIMLSIGNIQPTSTLLCFRAEVPESLKERQVEYELELSNRFANVYLVPVQNDPSIMIVKKNASLKQVIEVFERLHLNYLIIAEQEDNTKACGFIDRFLLARLIQQRFSGLRGEFDLIETMAEFDIDDESIDDLAPQRRNRESAEFPP